MQARKLMNSPSVVADSQDSRHILSDFKHQGDGNQIIADESAMFNVRQATVPEGITPSKVI